jgi:hypothetical protein
MVLFRVELMPKLRYLVTSLSSSQLLILFSLCLFISKGILTTHLLQLCIKLTLDKFDDNLL